MYGRVIPLLFVVVVGCGPAESADASPEAGAASGSEPGSLPYPDAQGVSPSGSSSGSVTGFDSGSKPGPDSTSGSAADSGDERDSSVADSSAGSNASGSGDAAAIDDATVLDTATGDDSSGDEVTDASPSDDGLAAMCATKLCVDPVFDCILQGCGAAVCQNAYCIIPSE